MKPLRKLTALLLLTATMFTFASCNKEENPITEANLVGEWGFTDYRQNADITINADHTCKVDNHVYNWTLTGNMFKATVQDSVIEFSISSLNENIMKVTGSRTISGSPFAYSGTLFRTHTETPVVLNGKMMVGTWQHGETVAFSLNFILNRDYTCFCNNKLGTWSIDNNTLTIKSNDGLDNMNATVKSATISAKKIALDITGSLTTIRPQGNYTSDIAGTLVKNL